MSEGILEKMKYLIGIETVDDEDEDDYEEKKALEKDYSRDYSRPVLPISSQTRDNKVVNLQQKGHMKLVVHEPSNFEECPKIVDNLKNKKPVIINLEKVETDVAKRIFDFVSGATYAADGSVQKVANNIFVFAPENVDISSNLDLKDYQPSPKSSIFR